MRVFGAPPLAFAFAQSPWPDRLQGAANTATVIGVLVAVAASVIAVASLRSQAKSQRLQAIIKTNEFWQAVSAANPKPVTLSRSTVAAVRRVYADLTGDASVSALATGAAAHAVSAPMPFVVGALLPRGAEGPAGAPESEPAYLAEMRARALALGYVRTVLGEAACAPAWLSSAAQTAVSRDFARLDRAMETWVNRMNEVAELYEGNLIDRRRFVGKRSVALVQQLFVAEPYILWRNSTTPGRWGLRVLGFGPEARVYHWLSPLQRAAIRLRSDPSGYGQTTEYPGFSVALGWIIGPGDPRRGPLARQRSELRMRRTLGAGYGWSSKSRQNQLVGTLPSSPESGLAPGPFTWTELAADPAQVRDAVALLGRR